VVDPKLANARTGVVIVPAVFSKPTLNAG